MSIPNTRYDPDFPPKTNLIINYIPPTLTENELVSIFSEAGPVESVRIMKNFDGTGKGYGFVKFRHSGDAEEAIKKFDGMFILGKNLKVAFSRPGASRDNANLFVTHLPFEWTSTYLGQHFSMFGEVVEARVLERNGTSRLCGFVRFNKSEDALHALQHRHGWNPPGAHRPLKVTIVQKERRFWRNKKVFQNSGTYRSRSDAYARSRESSYYAKSNSMPSPYSSEFEYMDRNYRSPNSVYCSPDYLKEQSNEPEYEEIKKIPNKSSSVDLTKKISLSKDSSPSEDSAAFMYNLPEMFTEDDVKNLCVKYGEVKDVKLQEDKNGKSMGMAMVAFHNPEDANQACEGLSGCKILEKEIQVQIL